jgi:hypothetical protein
MRSELGSYAIAFLLTLVTEVAVALALGYRKRREIASVVWVNVFSHPLLIYLIWILDWLRSAPVNFSETLLLEAAVVVVEWKLLYYALVKQGKARLFLLSLTMNSVSFVAGLLFPVWMP